MVEGPGGPTEESRERRRGTSLAAILIIALGVLLLLQTTQVLPWDLWSRLWRFWPVALMAIGVNVLIGRRAPWLALFVVLALLAASVGGAFALSESFQGPIVRSATVTHLDEPLGGVSSADLDIGFGAGELRVTALPASSSNLVEGRFEGRGAKTRLDRAGDSADLNIDMEAPAFGHLADTKWEIRLSQVPELSMELDGGAARIELDLRELRVTNLDMGIGAAELIMTLPARAGHVEAEISGGAADIDIVVPDGVAARITVRSGFSSLEIDGRRFPTSGGVYESADFASAQNRIDVELDVGASSVTVR